MRAKIRQYSGVRSVKFWKRIKALPWQESGETAYILGCALQDLEGRVMNYLENAEEKLRPTKQRDAK